MSGNSLPPGNGMAQNTASEMVVAMGEKNLSMAWSKLSGAGIGASRIAETGDDMMPGGTNGPIR